MTPLFFETVNNTAPAGLKAGLFTSADGFSLRYALCNPPKEQPLSGTVILLHGRNEAIEKYYETIHDLNSRDFCVATMDWRGQGGSFRMLKDTARGYVRHFADYCSDFEIFINTIVLAQCPPPYYLLAHSTGGLIALHSHELLQQHIRRMVMVSPFLGVSRGRFSERQLRPLARLLSCTGFGTRYAGKVPLILSADSFGKNPLSHDETRYLRNALIIQEQPQLGIAGPTIQWLYQTLHAIEKINKPQFFENFAIPTLVFVAGQDRVVSSKAAADFARKLHSASVITIDGAYHELLQESDFYREQVWAGFDAFIPGTMIPETTATPRTTSVSA